MINMANHESCNPVSQIAKQLTGVYTVRAALYTAAQ
jgi:hypothetical protein